MSSISTADFPTRFFLETLHPSPVVGDMIVARLFDRATSVDMPDFGVPLQDAATPERFTEDQAKLRGWEEAHPDLVAQIQKLVEQEWALALSSEHRPVTGR
jgi:hypothetical protein